MPGEPDMWVFVLIEAVVFGSYFVVYMIYRAQDPDLYLRSQQHLSQGFGVVNTLVLLASSWFMARSVEAAREGRYDAALGRVLVTGFCGLVFLATKLFEWSEKIAAGFELTTNEFFSFYYFLTGIHVLHLLIGFIVLGVVAYQLQSPLRRSQAIVESGATYWHMVDFLWVMIFALLYVMR